MVCLKGAALPLMGLVGIPFAAWDSLLRLVLSLTFCCAVSLDAARTGAVAAAATAAAVFAFLLLLFF